MLEVVCDTAVNLVGTHAMKPALGCSWTDERQMIINMLLQR